MGRKLLNAFKTELDNIKNETLKKEVKDILNKCSDKNAIMPASSSGKYHPEHDLGDGGLIRHIKVVCKNIETIMKMMPQYDGEDHDIPYIAALLHDLGKYESMDQQHSNMDHALIMAKFIADNVTVTPQWQRIIDCVASHMSRWNEDKNGKKLGELPKNMENMIVAISDMLSAAKYLHVNFDNNEIVC